jgi:hypothetical protein
VSGEKSADRYRSRDTVRSNTLFKEVSMSNLERLMRAATHHRRDDREAVMQRIEARRDERLGYPPRTLMADTQGYGRVTA